MTAQFKGLTDAKTAEALLAGQIGVIPTDEGDRLACLAADHEAVERLYGLEHVPESSLEPLSVPGIIIADSIEQLVSIGFKRRYLVPFEPYWPGAVSVIIPCGQELEYLHRGSGGAAVRIPADAALRALLARTGPLLTMGAAPPDLSRADRSIDFYAEDGNLSDRKPSTIIRVIDDELVVVRQGAVTIGE